MHVAQATWDWRLCFRVLWWPLALSCVHLLLVRCRTYLIGEPRVLRKGQTQERKEAGEVEARWRSWFQTMARPIPLFCGLCHRMGTYFVPLLARFSDASDLPDDLIDDEFADDPAEQHEARKHQEVEVLRNKITVGQICMKFLMLGVPSLVALEVHFSLLGISERWSRLSFSPEAICHCLNNQRKGTAALPKRFNSWP